MKTNVLYISPNFDYSCGVSKHVYINLKKNSNNDKYKLFFITNKGDALDRLNNISNIHFEIINFEKDHKNIFKMINHFLRLYSFCKQNKINIIHTHHRYPELLAVLVSKFMNIKTVTTVHSFVKGLQRTSFRSDRIIAVSESVKKYLYENYPQTKTKCVTLYNCVETFVFTNDEIDQNQIKKSFGYELSDKILLFVGRINKIKGVDILIEAFKNLPYELKIKLLLVGSITDEYCRNLLFDKNNNIKHIESKNDIRIFYNMADVVVLPSREDPFPYVMLESGAMHKPFLGSKTGGISEFIDDGINGFLFESENVNELNSKIIYLFSNPEISLAAAEKLYDKVKDICNCKKYFEVLDKIYIELVS